MSLAGHRVPAWNERVHPAARMRSAPAAAMTHTCSDCVADTRSQRHLVARRGASTITAGRAERRRLRVRRSDSHSGEQVNCQPQATWVRASLTSSLRPQMGQV